LTPDHHRLAQPVECGGQLGSRDVEQRGYCRDVGRVGRQHHRLDDLKRTDVEPVKGNLDGCAAGCPGRQHLDVRRNGVQQVGPGHEQPRKIVVRLPTQPVDEIDLRCAHPVNVTGFSPTAVPSRAVVGTQLSDGATC
jgi:hypothetical protein